MKKPPAAAPWSYSRISSFENCPKQFYHTTVLREYPFEETEAMRYGTEFHKAAEDFIRDGTPISAKFAFAQPMLDALAARPGLKVTEQKLGLTAELKPCGFFDKDVWFRGIVDLTIVEDETCYIVDYKTGKSSRYADPGQLELMALTVFAHRPEVKEIRAGLLFVIADDFVKATYHRNKRKELWLKWLAKYDGMDKAFESGVWNPKPSGLCKRHCPVKQCPHNGVY